MEYVRIAILSPYDVFLGAMDNEAEDSLHYYDDKLIEYLKGTASTFSCKVNAQHEDSRHLVEGNKLSFRYQNKDYYLNIMHVERDEYEVYIEAYTLSFELLNEKRSAYKASTAMSFEEYLEVFDPEHVVSLGLNEVSDKKILHEWTGEETILGRLFSLATVFSAELEFLPRLNDNYSLKQIVMNAYKEHSDTVQGVGRDRTDLVLRYNKQISGIKKTSDITELYTAITPTGRDGLTLASLDKTEYDSEGKVEYRKPAGSTHLYAVQGRDRFPSNLMAAENERYIGVDWEYDTDNVNTLYGQALAQLKKNCVPQVSYEVEGYFDTGIGDTVIIADEDFNPELYLQARVTEQHRSFTDPTQNKTTFDNFRELQSQIDESLLSRVEELIAQGKTYTAMISTDNGIVFRNGIGETTMTAHVRDAGGVELADNYEIHWLKDGAEVYIGNPYTITANDVEGKAVYRFEAVDTSGTVKAFYEVTVSDVSDGGKGDPGEDGRSVVSVTEEYYLSTSKTELIGGEWTEIPPTWTKGTYLWKRTKYVYENPPGTEYTTPICDSSWEAANDVSDDLHNNYYDKEETDTKIQDASDKADQAIADAENAENAANEAKESAQEAISKADSASQNAAEAKEEAAKSQQAASNAQNEITKINGEITTVKDDIDTALEDLADQAAETESIKKTMEVEYAKKTDVSNIEAALKTEINVKVGELQSTVEKTYAAKTEIINLEGKLQTQITQNADNLSSTATKVEKLESDTEEAQKQVDQAIAKADTAQSAADAAQADATAAQTAATSAQQKADAAQALADTADKAVQAAKSDLDEAKRNLTNVTNRVGATEADIAAAQAKVDAAQEAVDNALENAAEANLAASNAQQAADQAKLDAQEAQTAADKAQEDASQALKDVAALTQRVTTAETKIEQNSEQITLTASKIDEIGSRKVVTDTVPYFYLSTSSAQLVGGSWSTTPPAWREGTYYWQKVKTIYFDGTSSESTPICITGNTGADGTGVTILGSYDTEEELTEAHPTGSPGDSYMVSGDLYVWDSNTSKWKNVGRIKGEQGDPGPNGRSIASMTLEFYLSTSKTTQSGGTWTTTPPDWVKGKYLWTRNKIVYENPTSTEYTTPVCDTSWEAANDVADDLHNNYYNKTETEAKIQVASESITSTVKTTVTEEIEKIEIGGRNLLKNSSLRVDTNEWEIDPSTTSNVTVSQTEKDNNTCTLIDSSTLSTSDYHFWQNLDVGKLELNGTYTVSLWILAENVSKSNAGGTAACQFEITNAQTSGVDLHYHQKVLDNGYADWTKLSWTFTVTNTTLTTASTIYFGLYLKNTTGDFYIRDIQLEKGSIATDWAPAPEDLATSEAVQNAQTAADSASSIAISTDSRVTVAESTIQQLSDAISSLVVDENGESMMTQTSDGWRFEMGSINSQLNEAKDQLNELSGEMTQADETISNLNDLANDLSEKTAYITMTTDEEGNPCIELGKSDNEFKVRITNTSIDFMQGGLKMAYFSNNSLYIEKAIIKNELQIGEGNGFIWRTRSNGHLGLRYVEGVSS